jgi:hypothetical protein
VFCGISGWKRAICIGVALVECLNKTLLAGE